MALKANERWIDMLDEVVEEINNTKISRMGFRPNQIGLHNERAVYHAFYAQPRPFSNPRFRVGEKVRKSEPLLQFRKSYFPSWSFHVYTITRINNKYPNVYKLSDYYGNEIDGFFYTEELNRVKFPDYFLIQNIIRTRGNMSLVRWFGYTEVTWINTGAIHDVREED